MKKSGKSALIGRIGAVCGIIGGIGLIYSAVTDGNIPKIMWLIISVCEFILVFSLICNYKENK